MNKSLIVLLGLVAIASAHIELNIPKETLMNATPKVNFLKKLMSQRLESSASAV